jgi:hypothetical protein
MRTLPRALVLGSLLGLAACGSPAPAPSPDAATPDAPVCNPDPAVFASTVRPVVQQYCGTCHGETPNFGAPVSLLDATTLLAVRPDGTRLVDRMGHRLLDGSMPPVGMPRLPEADANTIANWASCGAITVPPSTGLVASRAPFLAPETGPAGFDTVDFRATGYPVGPMVADDYHCFVFDAPVTEPRFVRRFEMIFGETAVLHHLVLLRDVDHHLTPGDFDCYDGSGMPAGSEYLYAWAPGQSALEFPDGGLRMSPGDRYVVQIHYNNGRHLPNVMDTSGVRMFVGPTTGPEYGMIAAGPLGFVLPPHVTTSVSSRCTFASDATIIAGLPHMHLLGQAFDESITRASGGAHESLIHLTGWSFNTQLFYGMPVTLHAGDAITTTCTYDNNRDDVVSSGENTTDEMCFDFMYVTPPPTQRYCDEGPNDHPTDVTYVPGACLPAGTPTDALPLVRGTWTLGATPPALVQASVPDARWVLDSLDYTVTGNATPIGTIDLAATYVLARGQVVTEGGNLHYDVSQDNVVLTDSHVRFGSPQHNGFAGTFPTTSSPATLALSCPSAGGSVSIDWGLEGDVLTVGFTSRDVPSQTLWPRFHFRRVP